MNTLTVKGVMPSINSKEKIPSLYIFNHVERLQAVLGASDAPGNFQENTLQYDRGHQYDTGMRYKKWSDKDPCPYWNAIHHEALNSENTFTFTVPAGHPFAQYVAEGNLVAFKDLDQDWQLFEIIRVTDVHGNGLTRTAFCEHAFYELLDDFIEDRRPTDCSAHFALTQALTDTRWEPGTVVNLGTNSTNFYYESARSAIRKVKDIWGGELRFRVEVSGGVISGRYVDLLERRGEDTGKQWEHGRHTLNIEREVDMTTVRTALYGRGKGVETEAGGHGRRLTFVDVEWSVANGDPTDKPAGQEWIGDPDALTRWGRSGGRHRVGAFEDADETDPAALLQKTWDELQEQKNPRATYRMTVLDLERLSGYEHEKVRLGDTTRVIDRKFSPPMLVEARVIEIHRDRLRPENTQITLGKFAPTLADDYVAQQKLNRIVSASFSPSTGKLATAWLDGKINVLTNQLEATTSNWRTDENGNLVFETTDGTAAMMLTGAGFMLANEKDGNGAWIWRTFGTGDGFTADELNAGKIQTSLIQIFGNSHFYWDSDFLYIIDPANQNKQIRLSKEGIRFTGDGGQTWTVAISVDGIMADAIVATTLSAISADMGEITAGKLTGGQIYSSLFKSGAEGATDYVQIDAGNSPVRVVEGGKTALELWTSARQGFAGSGGSVKFHDVTADDERGHITAFDDAMGDGLRISAMDGNDNRKNLLLSGSEVRIDAPLLRLRPHTGADTAYLSVPLLQITGYVLGNLKLNGDIESTGNVVTVDSKLHATGHITSGGTKFAVQRTQNYGMRCLAARESPDVRYIIEGIAKFVNGECRIDIDPTFLECIEINSEQTPWTFGFTPMFSFMGIFVKEIGDTHFVVTEKLGASNGQFCWKLSAVRKGCAGDWLPEFENR